MKAKGLGKRAVFLDRDGVLLKVCCDGGGSLRPAYSIEEFELLPRVSQALSLLRAAGLTLVVVTNQPDVVRGKIERGLVEAFHARLKKELGIEHIYTCYHDDSDDCPCRKPRPGLLKQAARELGISLAKSFMVGDRWRDIEAGRQAGCTTFLVRRPYSGKTHADGEVGSFFEAAQRILTLLRGKN